MSTCPRCHGNLYTDRSDDEYVCYSCARRYARVVRTPLSLDSEIAERRSTRSAVTRGERRWVRPGKYS